MKKWSERNKIIQDEKKSEKGSYKKGNISKIKGIKKRKKVRKLKEMETQIYIYIYI
jgi:hypothetical protein